MRLLSILMIAFIFVFSACKGKDSEKPIIVKQESSGSEQQNTSILENSTLPDEPVTQKEPRPLTIGLHKVIAENGLMLRSKADKESPAIVRMNKNMQAEIIEYTDKEEVIEGMRAKWAKVKYKKYTGYAFSSYLQPLTGAKTLQQPADKLPQK